MKLSKRTGLVVAAVVLVIVLFGVGRAYFQQVGEQKQVKEQLALAQSRLSGVQLEELSSKKTELEKQLSRTTLELETAKATLPQSLEDLDVSTTLFDLAKAYSVEVTGITFSSTANETLEGVIWSVTSLTIRLEGDAPNLVGLITKLNSRFATGVIKAIAITIPQMNSEERASADIRLAIYTYQGG